MKVFVSFFILISLFHHSYSQDSIKIKSKIILNVQRWPESRYSISTMKVDSANGIFVRVLSLETDPFLGEIDYSLIEANDLAIIKADPNSKDAFFVTPVSKKLKAKELNKIQLEVWIKFNSKVNDLYIPVLKTGKEEENLYDKAGEVIPENAMWKKLRDVYTFRIDKIKISEYWISVIQ